MPISRMTLSLFGLFIIGLFILINALTLQWLLPGYTYYDIRRLTQISLFLIVGLLLISSKALRQESIGYLRQLPLVAQGLILGFFALGMLSASLAALPKFGFLEWATFMMLLITGICLAGLRKLLILSFDRILLYTWIVSIACYSLIAIAVLLTAATHPYIGMGSDRIFYVLAAPTFNNPRFLTQFMAWTLPLIVLPNLLYPSRFRLVRIIFYMVSAYWWCLAIVGQSRALGLACILSAAVLFILFHKAAKPYLLKQLWALMGGMVLYFVLYQGLVHLPIRDIALTDPNSRGLIWSVALSLAKTHPLLGVGPMHFSYYAFSQEQLVAHPHNAILLIASQWGIPAALIFVALIMWGLWQWLKFSRQQQNNPSSLIMGLTASMLIASIDSMFSGTLVMPASQVMLAIIAGWSLSIYFQTRPSQIMTSSLLHYGILALFIACAVIIIIGICPEVANLPQIESNYLVSCSLSNCVNSPYYWLQGWIQFY